MPEFRTRVIQIAARTRIFFSPLHFRFRTRTHTETHFLFFRTDASKSKIRIRDSFSLDIFLRLDRILILEREFPWDRYKWLGILSKLNSDRFNLRFSTVIDLGVEKWDHFGTGNISEENCSTLILLSGLTFALFSYPLGALR